MAESLAASMVESIRGAAKKMTGFRRRQFQAEMCVKYCDGSARHAETVFGWGREAVKKGLHELRTGERFRDHFSSRGRHKTKVRFPKLAQRIHALVEPESQADPKFQTPFAFTRMAVLESTPSKMECSGGREGKYVKKIGIATPPTVVPASDLVNHA